FYFLLQPASFSSSNAVYAGMPITFSALATNVQPLAYQWYEVAGALTNLLAGETNTSCTHLVQGSDVGGVSFFAVAGNGSASITSAPANLNLSGVVPSAPASPVSLQFTITNYSGYSGFQLAP